MSNRDKKYFQIIQDPIEKLLQLVTPVAHSPLLPYISSICHFCKVWRSNCKDIRNTEENCHYGNALFFLIFD